MLESICHPNITQFIGVCSKPVAITMDYECFDFSPFGLNQQISNLLESLNTLHHIEGKTEAFEHFLPVFPKAARTSRKVSAFLIQMISCIVTSNQATCWSAIGTTIQ